jgi:anti-sigma factor RsiW
MTCTQYREWIEDLVDGTIVPIRRAELERHLAACDACRALAADLQIVHDTAASLEPLEPPAGVWLQIAGRLRQQGRVSPPPQPAARRGVRHTALLAIAAALMLVVGGSIVMLWTEYRGRNGRPEQTASVAAPAPATQPAGNVPADVNVESVEAEFRLAEQHYQNAIAKLEQAARLDQAASGGSPSVLDPQTAAMLQKNLQVIDQAIAESRSALRAEPLSAPARDSLFDALRRKVALLQDTIALMNEMRKGNAAGAAQIVDGVNKS